MCIRDSYLRHLNADGVIASHISNRHLDLLPVLKQVTKRFDLELLFVRDYGSKELGTVPSDWVLMHNNSQLLSEQVFKIHQAKTEQLVVKDIELWTDDYSNIFTILK